jgi:uncharacterized protein
MDFDLFFPRIIYRFLSSRPYRKTTLRYKGKRISMEIADTFAKQMIGLMYRKSIDGNKGMLFPLAFSTRTGSSIIMLNMKFAIDILWLDDGKKVIDICRSAKPAKSIFSPSYTPRAASKYVIELRAGTAKRLGVKRGDRLSFMSNR